MTILIIEIVMISIIAVTTIIVPLISTVLPYITNTGRYPSHIIARMAIRLALVILLVSDVHIKYDVLTDTAPHHLQNKGIIVSSIVAAFALASTILQKDKPL